MKLLFSTPARKDSEDDPVSTTDQTAPAAGKIIPGGRAPRTPMITALIDANAKPRCQRYAIA